MERDVHKEYRWLPCPVCKNRTHTKVYADKLKLNRKTDDDILKWLYKQKYGRQTSMQGEIKRLIREEIARTSRSLSVYTDK